MEWTKCAQISCGMPIVFLLLFASLSLMTRQKLSVRHVNNHSFFVVLYKTFFSYFKDNVCIMAFTSYDLIPTLSILLCPRIYYVYVYIITSDFALLSVINYC